MGGGTTTSITPRFLAAVLEEAGQAAAVDAWLAGVGVGREALVDADMAWPLPAFRELWARAAAVQPDIGLALVERFPPGQMHLLAHLAMRSPTVGAALGSLAFGLFESEFSLRPSWPAHGWLIALALTTQVLGWLLIGVALPRLPALETSVMLLLQPMATVLWASLIFREVLSPIQWMGMLLVLGGIVVLSWKGSARAGG